MTFTRYLNQFVVLSRRQKKRVASFVRRLAKDNDKVLFDDKALSVLLKYAKDASFVRKVQEELNQIEYAQSRKEAAQLDKMIDLFSSRHAENAFSNPIYRKALAIVENEFKTKAKLQPLKYSCDEDMKEALPKSSTHAGQTGVISGKSKKKDNLGDIFHRWKGEMADAKSRGTFGKLLFPGVRTQNSSPYSGGKLKTKENLPPRSKTRLVAMVDLMVIFAELIFSKPIQWFLSTVDWYAGGKTPAQLRKIIRQAWLTHRHWISIDYSKYDSSLPGWLIRDAFSAIRESFKNDFDEEAWRIVVHDFVNKNYLTTKGTVVTCHDGVPSGSMFTQIIDSVCNRIMVICYMLSRGISNYEMCIMGDDNIIFTNVSIDRKDLAQYIYHMFGVEVNYRKTAIGDSSCDPEFLSREWREDGEWRDPETLITKILYPERFRNYSDMATPEMVILSYCLSYPLGMAEVIDMDSFLRDVRPDINSLVEGKETSLEGYYRFQAIYNHVNMEESGEWYLVKQAALASRQEFPDYCENRERTKTAA